MARKSNFSEAPMTGALHEIEAGTSQSEVAHNLVRLAKLTAATA
jgi:hypothetical protein